MQPIVTFTKIHGKGNEFLINELIHTELARQRELDQQRMNRAIKDYEMEMRCMSVTMNANKHERIERLKKICAKLKADEHAQCNKSIFRKAKETLIFVWACIYYLTVRFGLVEYEYEEGVWNKK